MPGELLTADWREFIYWIGRRRRRFRVNGNSMLPLLQPGEEILVNVAAYRHALPQVGHIVVVEHPERPGFQMVKRVAAVDENGNCVVVGDNPYESTDSRTFGAVSHQLIIGQVTSRFS